MDNSSYGFSGAGVNGIANYESLSGGGRRKARRGKRKTARRSTRKTARRSVKRSNRKRVFRRGKGDSNLRRGGAGQQQDDLPAGWGSRKYDGTTYYYQTGDPCGRRAAYQMNKPTESVPEYSEEQVIENNPGCDVMEEQAARRRLFAPVSAAPQTEDIHSAAQAEREAMRSLFAKEEAEAKRVADEAAAEKKEKEAREAEAKAKQEAEAKAKQEARDKEFGDLIAKVEKEMEEKDADLTRYKDSLKQLAEANRAYEANHNKAMARINKEIEEVKSNMQKTSEKIADPKFMIPSRVPGGEIKVK